MPNFDQLFTDYWHWGALVALATIGITVFRDDLKNKIQRVSTDEPPPGEKDNPTARLKVEEARLAVKQSIAKILRGKTDETKQEVVKWMCREYGEPSRVGT